MEKGTSSEYRVKHRVDVDAQNQRKNKSPEYQISSAWKIRHDRDSQEQFGTELENKAGLLNSQNGDDSGLFLAREQRWPFDEFVTEIDEESNRIALEMVGTAK